MELYGRNSADCHPIRLPREWSNVGNIAHSRCLHILFLYMLARDDVCRQRYRLYRYVEEAVWQDWIHNWNDLLHNQLLCADYPILLIAVSRSLPSYPLLHVLGDA